MAANDDALREALDSAKRMRSETAPSALPVLAGIAVAGLLVWMISRR